MNFGVIVAAGKSARMGPGVDKAFLSLGTKPVLAYSLLAFEKCADIDGIVLVVRKDRVEAARSMARMYGCSKLKRVVAGGTKRQVSVLSGLKCVDESATIVSVHDGARPVLKPQLISDTIKAAKRYGSGVAAVRVTDTIKEVKSGSTVSRTLDRNKIWAVQTPQSFKLDVLLKAFDAVKKKGVTVTDEASALELISSKVHLVQSTPANIKITSADDLALAAALLRL